MKNIYTFIPVFVLVIFSSSYLAFAQEPNKNHTLDELQIEGNAVAAEDVDGILAAISRKYDVKIALFSDRPEIPSGKGVIKVGSHLAYFEDMPKITPESGSLRSVLQKLLPPRYEWKFESKILYVTPTARIIPEIELFLSTPVVVPEIDACKKCTVSKSIWIDDPTSGKPDSFVSKILADASGVESKGAPERQRMITVRAFLIELLDKGRFRYVRLKRFESEGKLAIYLTLEE
ncbi:MAG: hypothetical protein IPM50_15280 [Acidobacteriota bacterium]|nr:MAG: hypothetical protein IPM50_15280 [Acidobacteriota bacterium]